MGRFDDDGRVWVDAVLDEKVKTSFIVDTAFASVLLTRETARELGIKIEQAKHTESVELPDGRSIQAIPVKLKSLTIGEITLLDLDAYVDSDKSVDAKKTNDLLGVSFLKRFEVRIDYQDKKFTLAKRS